MFQKNVIIEDLEDLNSKLPFLKMEFASHAYTGGIIETLVGNIKDEELEDILGCLKENFPNFSIVGMSSFATTFLLYKKKKCVLLTFTLMKEATVTLFHNFAGAARSNSEIVTEAHEYSEKVSKQIKELKDVKAIQIFLAGRSALSPILINGLSKEIENVPVFGAVAAINRFDENDKNANFLSKADSFVISDDKFGKGVSIAVYQGKELYAYVDYLFGWEPIGRYMDIEASNEAENGSIIVSSLDGKKPVEVFTKYLGVRASDALVPNLGEFPLVVERDGIIMGRTPSAAGENGEILLEGDIRKGEKVRFSFGVKEKILENTKSGAEKMKNFGAEYLQLIVCGNRLAFLRDDYHLELDYYSEGRYERPELCLGMGEIYRYEGKGGILNSALIAVGMREGIPEIPAYATNTNDNLEHEHKNGIIPLSERLAHFLSAMTGELIEAVEEAKAANDAKSSFLSNMSHEIRTPINAVLGMDEMIIRECKDPQILEYAQNIKSAGNTLLGLINDILDFSKIEAGKMDIILVDYDFSSVINDLVHMIKPKAQGKGLDFVVDVDEKIPSILYGDEIRIKQVITNVLTNAVKYTEKGYVALNIQHEMASDDEVILKFMIKDTGIGIKEEDLGKLTEAFQRVDEVRNRTVEGTGLGLNITQKLLEHMGSKLNVESNYGTGSIFSFDIRQKVIRNDPIGDYMEAYKKALIEQKKYHERFAAPDARVLVVDDTPINLDVFEGLLKTTKVKIDRAESGPECLEKTREKRYDIIFLDHRMPGMDGIETLKRLKEDDNNKNKGVPIICLTANAISGAREIYIRAGFDEYLTKPIMSEKLELLMTKFLPAEKVSIEITEVDADNQVNIEYDLLPHWIKNAPLIVLEEGIKNCGSQEAFVTAATTYRSNLEENYSAIKDAFENGDIENFTIKVHALKSSSRILGIYNLAELAEELEKAGDEKNIDFINKETPRLLNLYKDIWERMGSIPETDDEETELPLMEEKAVEDAKNALRELAQSFDFDSINYIMETIKGFRVPDEHREFFKNMRAAIHSADWDGIKKLLDAGGNDGQ